MTILRNKHNTATLEDQSDGKHEIELDVNWDKDIKDMIKLTFDDKIAYVRKSDLFAFMFVLATPEQQEALIPVRRDEVKAYDRQHRVELLKDMKKGEELVVNCKIHVPTIIDEAIRNEKKDENNFQSSENSL